MRSRLFAALGALVLAPPALADPALADTGAASPQGALGIIWENDIFAGEDRKYTNGSFLRYRLPEGTLHLWGRGLKSVVEGFTPATRWGVTYGVGHSLFTSSDITDPDPPEDDRPYAGLLTGMLALHADAGDRLDVWALDVALVGPSAMGEEVQRWVHDTITGDDPQGWDTQLGDELTFRAVYEQTRRLPLAANALGMGFDADILPRGSVAIGTLETSAAGGMMLRLGEGLDSDYGPDRVRRSMAGPSFDDVGGWQVFAAADGYAVARNLLLDGNTFRDSRSVDAEPFFAEFSLGASYQWERVSLSYVHVLRSPEFATQDEWAMFGSLNLRIKF